MAKISKQEVLELCKKDPLFAEELFCELYIFYHYNEDSVGVDRQSFSMPTEPVTSTINRWVQNLKYRIISIFRAHGMSIQMDIDELEDLIDAIRQVSSTISTEVSIY